ncbi:MAG: ATP-binding cassette protein, partial [Burkholderia sp.]|nr:ATP-binding cassette protein [Burkholderia sp.]
PTTSQAVSGKETPKPAAKEAQVAPAKQKKLSYKDQRELETLPALIAGFEAEQKTISERLADPDLYKQQPAEVQRLNQRFAELDALLMENLEKWETIEAKSKG